MPCTLPVKAVVSSAKLAGIEAGVAACCRMTQSRAVVGFQPVGVTPCESTLIVIGFALLAEIAPGIYRDQVPVDPGDAGGGADLPQVSSPLAEGEAS